MTVLFGGQPVSISGKLPDIDSQTPEVTLVNASLDEVSLGDFSGSRLVLNIFPSIDTSTCATSVRKFNELASKLENTKVLCISRDLPFAQKRFCGAEGLDNVECLSDFNDGNFGKAFGLELLEGKFKGLHSRAIVVIDADGKVVHTEQVANISDEPDYESALASLDGI